MKLEEYECDEYVEDCYDFLEEELETDDVVDEDYCDDC